MKKLLKSLILVSVLFSTIYADTGFPKKYYKMHVSEQKKYFFNYFNERIEIENRKILKERAFVKSLNKNKNLDPNSQEYKKLQDLQTKYKVKGIYNYKRYLERIDIVPPSMALAQAATESGWGKSRFFKKANNIFGHWTYNPAIGMKPLRRPAGQKHFIRIFPTLQSSITAYMKNLNRTGAYYEFRLKRKQMRDANKLIDGMKLSATMSKYSGIGHNYVKILKSIIRKSKLVNFDKEFQKNMKNENEKLMQKQEKN